MVWQDIPKNAIPFFSPPWYGLVQIGPKLEKPMGKPTAQNGCNRVRHTKTQIQFLAVQVRTHLIQQSHRYSVAILPKRNIASESCLRVTQMETPRDKRGNIICGTRNHSCDTELDRKSMESIAYKCGTISSVYQSQCRLEDSVHSIETVFRNSTIPTSLTP